MRVGDRPANHLMPYSGSIDSGLGFIDTNGETVTLLQHCQVL